MILDTQRQKVLIQYSGSHFAPLQSVILWDLLHEHDLPGHLGCVANEWKTQKELSRIPCASRKIIDQGLSSSPKGHTLKIQIHYHFFKQWVSGIFPLYSTHTQSLTFVPRDDIMNPLINGGTSRMMAGSAVLITDLRSSEWFWRFHKVTFRGINCLHRYTTWPSLENPLISSELIRLVSII